MGVCMLSVSKKRYLLEPIRNVQREQKIINDVNSTGVHRNEEMKI